MWQLKRSDGNYQEKQPSVPRRRYSTGFDKRGGRSTVRSAMCGPAAADSDIGGAAAVRSSSKSSAGESMAEHARPPARDQLPHTPETVAVGGSERRSSQRRRNPKPSVTWRTVVAYSEWSHPGSTGDGFVEGRIEEKIGKAGLCVWRWGNAAVNSFFVYRNGAFSFSLFQHLLACYTFFIYNILKGRNIFNFFLF